MTEYVVVSAFLVAGLLLTLGLLAVLAFVHVVAHGEEIPSVCLCGSPVVEGEEYVVEPDGDRLFHRWCIPPEVMAGGDDCIRAWARQNDRLSKGSKDDWRWDDE